MDKHPRFESGHGWPIRTSGGEFVTSIPNTPSDHHGIKNARADLKRAGVEFNVDRKRQRALVGEAQVTEQQHACGTSGRRACADLRIRAGAPGVARRGRPASVTAKKTAIGVASVQASSPGDWDSQQQASHPGAQERQQQLMPMRHQDLSLETHDGKSTHA